MFFTNWKQLREDITDHNEGPVFVNISKNLNLK